MNILFTDDALLASERQTELLQDAIALSARGHGVAILCPRASALHAAALTEGLTVFEVEFGTLGRFAAARRIRTLERRTAADLVHVHGALDARACEPLHWTGTPVLRECGDAATFSRAWLGTLGCRRVLANTAVRQALISERNLSPNRVIALESSASTDPDARIDALLAAYHSVVGQSSSA